MRRLPTFHVGDWKLQSWISDRDALLIWRWLGERSVSSPRSFRQPAEHDCVDRLLSSPFVVAWAVSRMLADGVEFNEDWSSIYEWFVLHARVRMLNDAIEAEGDWRLRVEIPEAVRRASVDFEGSRDLAKELREGNPSGAIAAETMATLFRIGAAALLISDTKGNAIGWERWWSQCQSEHPIQVSPATSSSETGSDVPPTSFGDRLAKSLDEPLAEFANGFEDRLYRWAQLSKVEQQFDKELERAKLSAMKELAYGASHEINNPLANISTRAQTLLREETHPERRQKLAMINAQAFRAHEMISNMMLFAHPPDLQRERVSWQGVFDQVREELQTDADSQQTMLKVEPPGFDPEAAIAEMEADPTHLAVLLKALVRNSLEAIGTGGCVQLRCRFDEEVFEGESNHAARCVRLEVIDDGPGVDEEVRAHLFDPFYSGREAGRGLGFGLSKAWRIVEMHGGSLFLEPTKSRPDATRDVNEPARDAADNAESLGCWLEKGAVFVVQLPLPGEGVDSN